MDRGGRTGNGGGGLDRFARALAHGEVSRRDALGTFARVAAGASLSSPLWGTAAPAQAKTSHKKCKPGHVGCHGSCCAPGEHCVTPPPTGTGAHKKKHKPRCECPGHRHSCPTGCVDLKTDAKNCGACGHHCAAGDFCHDGVCSTTFHGCSAGQTMCSGGCTALATDPANCGACGHACPAGQTCSSGGCVTPSSRTCTKAADCPVGQACQQDGTCGTHCCNLEAGACPLASGGPTTKCNGGCCSGGVCVTGNTTQACTQVCAGAGDTYDQCGPVGDTAFDCAFCDENSYGGPMCVNGVGGCGCSGDADCTGPGACFGASNCKCDPTTHTCQIPCTGDPDCLTQENGAVCSGGFCHCSMDSQCFTTDACGPHNICYGGAVCSGGCPDGQCCAHGSCLPGNTNTQCGSPPNYCVDCTKSGQTCKNINGTYECA